MKQIIIRLKRLWKLSELDLIDGITIAKKDGVLEVHNMAQVVNMKPIVKKFIENNPNINE